MTDRFSPSPGRRGKKIKNQKLKTKMTDKNAKYFDFLDLPCKYKPQRSPEGG